MSSSQKQVPPLPPAKVQFNEGTSSSIFTQLKITNRTHTESADWVLGLHGITALPGAVLQSPPCFSLHRGRHFPHKTHRICTCEGTRAAVHVKVCRLLGRMTPCKLRLKNVQKVTAPNTHSVAWMRCTLSADPGRRCCIRYGQHRPRSQVRLSKAIALSLFLSKSQYSAPQKHVLSVFLYNYTGVYYYRG